ncbi:MAG TPA: ABC transporter permease [Candidatus Coprenecus pullistercoris]|nr:ABC transporter permease [Candidatus Coprenecus pullistercoris]
MNLYLFIAKKIKSHGLSSTSNGIACVSVAISIAVIIASVAISGGFKKEIGKRAAGFSGEILLTAPGADYMTDVYPLRTDLSYLPDIRNIPEVRSIYATAYRPGMIKSGDDVHGMMFKGVDSTYRLDFFADFLTEGSLPDFSGEKPADQILISGRLARMLGYSIGDRMTVYFVGEQVRARRFTISGLYDIQLEDMDERLAIVDIRQIRRLNGWDDRESSCLEISTGGDGSRASSRERARAYDAIGQIIMTKDSSEDAPVAVRCIDDIYPGLFDWLALLDLNVLVVMVLMMAVAGFNMISGLLIILFEKISMIGLLKALGMRTSGICRIFICRGGGIVLKGMIWGNIAAISLLAIQKWFRPVTLNPENYFVNFVPVDLSIPDILAINAAAFILMLLIMIIPSLFIAGISPDRTIKVN